MINISIILPTINEEENLKFLIPDIFDELETLEILEFEILVVDDGSTDNTKELIKKLQKNYSNLRIIERSKAPSLPMSILDGINNSHYQYVMWLDADGSMPAYVVKQLVEKQISQLESVIIGSRFVPGGGYKGVEKDKGTNLMTQIYNIYNSEDSILAVYLSKLFNKFLSRILNLKVKDLTSGFIIGKKSNFSSNVFETANYGDYFINLVVDLQLKSINCLEIPYYCETRKFGNSKTGSNYIELFKKGIPYLKLAYKLRK